MVFEELARRAGALVPHPDLAAEFSPGFIHGLRGLPVRLQAPTS